MDERTRTHIAAQLPYLRRHARALTGSQGVGDELVKRALQRVLDEAGPASGPPTRVDLFRSLHNVLDPAAVPPGPPAASAAATSSDALVQRRLEERVAMLPPRWRAALLLVHAEGMTRSEAAAVLGIAAAALSGLLDEAWTALRDEAPARVLIIEDEAVIALDIAGIVAEMGHAVVGVAARSDEAVRLARAGNPSLILADVQLEDGNTGIQTVRRILETADLPVVFVTAFPERLLTGERLEPTFVVAKPFEPEALQVAVSQALFCAASG
ncbi:PhyR family response regulator anti-anti-sigma factor [Stella sp.]|uniref:PhyR family response regulator anti-anti-sigma factor n=1 Tax=Stella sp. TaxID=2912054 RepID=UPI0035B064E5